MIYPDEHFYVVDSFGRGSDQMSSWGFSIGLDSEFAKRFYEREITDEEFENINLHGKNLVKNIFNSKEISFIDTPYHFLRNDDEKSTFLLQWCSVIGNACDLGIDGRDLGKIKKWDEYTMGGLIEYGPHNVDSLQQASALFTIWNEWVKIAYALTHDD
tara:strand:+ start:4894 stop:5367 length:474 start_codon:yes stop_codon:yes gene_type:complete